MTGFATRALPVFSVVLLAAVLGACSQRGVVGVTSSRSADHDAAAVAADAASRPDARPPGDGAAPRSVHIDDCLPANPANLDFATAQRLVDTPGDASGMAFLYPYDGTVYPQGIPGPVFMWVGPPPDVVYVRVHSRTFDYRGCLKPTEPNRLVLPSGVWDLLAASTSGAADPFTVELKSLSGETISGPISERIVIARGALRGSVYYMTTTSPAIVGGVMRVRLGGAAEAFIAPPSCAGCHSVSANGARMLGVSSAVGGSYALSGSATPTPVFSPTPGAEFAGIYPDGSVYVAGAHPTPSGSPRSYGTGVTSAGLYDTATGTLVSGSGIPPGAGMPSFSVDGQQLVFTDLGDGAGHSLASMRFSIAARAASGYRGLYSTASQFVGWPSFLPDGRAVVFTQGEAADFSGGNGGLIPGIRGAVTDLYIVDATMGKASMLARAMGFASPAEIESGQTYLPGGSVDLHQSYYPSVSPEAPGGYAWVFFDSMRAYGNQGTHRSIWVSALTLSSEGGYDADPSHPAFFLPGQDLNTPNFRAVAVPDP